MKAKDSFQVDAAGDCGGKKKSGEEPARDCHLLEPVSFSGIGEKILEAHLENCTARWKTSCKEPVAKTILQLVSGRANQSRNFDSYSIL